MKQIALQVKDSLGNSISHPFNGKEIHLAKNNGLLLFYNTLNFPDDTTSFILVGKSDPDEGVVNLTEKEIYDWDIGVNFIMRVD